MTPESPPSTKTRLLLERSCLVRCLPGSAVLIVLVVFLVVSPTGVHGSDTGFVEAVQQASVRMTSWPQDTITRRLLERFKPRVYVSPRSYLPIGFYEDYLPKTVLKHESGRVVSRQVSRERLNRYRNTTDHVLDYTVRPARARALTRSRVTPTLYGRVYADTLANGRDTVPLLFLKYSPVFPYSGLPDGISGWKEAGVWAMANPWGWHELDIHGAVHVVLHAPTRRPLGLLLAQHNHHRTWLRAMDFPWPDDDRVRVAFAVRSNEPYLITRRRGTRFEPTVGNPRNIPALFERTLFRPLSAGYDRILGPEDGARKVTTRLRLLPLEDPLYTSTMNLGDRLTLVGVRTTWFRAGPPGMDYYAHPSLINLADLLAFWNINRNDDRFFRRLADQPRDFETFDAAPLLRLQSRKTLREIRMILPMIARPSRTRRMTRTKKGRQEQPWKR